MKAYFGLAILLDLNIFPNVYWLNKITLFIYWEFTFSVQLLQQLANFFLQGYYIHLQTLKYSALDKIFRVNFKKHLSLFWPTVQIKIKATLKY